MADVSIDSTISTSTARGMRSVVFVDANTGYWSYIDSNSDLVYEKTTDGGATWGAAVTIESGTKLAYDVWYDQWTPGDSGSKIHIWSFGTVSDDVTYFSLDTSSDTLSAAVVVFNGATSVAGRGVFVSGTKTRSGYLYCAYDIDAGAEKGFHRSTDGGATWSASLASTFVEATIDQCKLFPASGTGDDNDCWAIYQDASADALTLKLWDSSAAAAVESATIMTLAENTTDLTGQYQFDAAVRHSDGHLILAARAQYLGAPSDHRVWDIASTSSFTEKAKIATAVEDHQFPQVFIDQTTNDIYVAYNGLRDGSQAVGSSTKVYYTKSTDGGTTWSAGDTAYMQGANAAVMQVWSPISGPRFYVGWRVGSTLIGNAVNSLTFAAGPTTLVLADALMGLSTDAAPLTQANTLALADALLSLSAENVAVTANALTLIVADALMSLTADVPTLTQANVLAVADALLTIHADATSLTQANVLALADALMGLAADSPALVQAHILALADSLLSLTAEGVTVGTGIPLVLADAALSLSAESPTLSQAYLLAMQDALLTIAAENPGLTQGHLLVLNDAAMALTGESLDLSQGYVLVVSDAGLLLLADDLVLNLANVTFTMWIRGGPVITGSIQGGGVLSASITGEPVLQASMSGGPV